MPEEDPSQPLLLAEERERRQRAEARLASAERLATVGTLAAGVAHEINNPLTWVMSNLEEIALGLEDRSVPRAHLVAYVREANDGVERIRSIVEGLRTFIHGDDDRRSPVRVEDALELALKVATGELRGRATVERRFGDTPEVLANEGRLSQLFLNLIINAVQAFGDERSNTLVLVTDVERDDVVIEVRDNGPGIPREYVSRLFDPFFTTKPVGVGSGLGLSICLNIVRTLDGSIDIETEVGEGTTFRIRLPQAPATRFSDVDLTPLGDTPVPDRRMPTLPLRSSGDSALPPRSGDYSLPAATPLETPVQKWRILLVDDEPSVLQALTRVLRRTFDVVPARSGREAMELVRVGMKIDAVVTDLRMPDGSGMELHTLLEDEAPLLAERLLFLTGGGLAREEFMFLDKPGRRWVSKPVKAANLVALVQELMTIEP
ncbi:MAG: response regulator [Deltaproteobacteria bacterium]|nr:response regulator [Deltaproteobacteria bacterium]